MTGRDAAPEPVLRDAAAADVLEMETGLARRAGSVVAGWHLPPHPLHPDRDCDYGDGCVRSALQPHRPVTVRHWPVVGILLVCRVRPLRHCVVGAADVALEELAARILKMLRSPSAGADLPHVTHRRGDRVGADVLNGRLVIGHHRPVGPVLAVDSDLLIASSFSAKNANVGGKYTEPHGRGPVAPLPFKRMVANRWNAHLDELLDVAQGFTIFRRGKRNGNAATSCTACAANSVDVCFGRFRHVEVHDIR